MTAQDNHAFSLTIELGLLCGDVAKEVKRAARQYGLHCDHAKGPGWLSAKHTFAFYGNPENAKRFQSALLDYLHRVGEPT